MKACFPVIEDRGLESRVSPHFGSAPMFLLVDTETKVARAIVNANEHHEHGRCQPLRALAGEAVDAFVVGGIGAGALARLAETRTPVYRTTRGTVGLALAALGDGALPPVLPEEACVHGHGEAEGSEADRRARPLRVPPRHGA